MVRSLREEQLVYVIADAAGPLRSCAETILKLRDNMVKSPKEALQHIVKSFAEPGWDEVLDRLSEAREKASLPPGTAAPVVFKLMELADRMRAQAEIIPQEG